jgi:hypothetical protein
MGGFDAEARQPVLDSLESRTEDGNLTPPLIPDDDDDIIHDGCDELIDDVDVEEPEESYASLGIILPYRHADQGACGETIWGLEDDGFDWSPRAGVSLDDGLPETMGDVDSMGSAF